MVQYLLMPTGLVFKTCFKTVFNDFLMSWTSYAHIYQIVNITWLPLLPQKWIIIMINSLILSISNNIT